MGSNLLVKSMLTNKNFRAQYSQFSDNQVTELLKKLENNPEQAENLLTMDIKIIEPPPPEKDETNNKKKYSVKGANSKFNSSQKDDLEKSSNPRDIYWKDGVYQYAKDQHSEFLFFEISISLPSWNSPLLSNQADLVLKHRARKNSNSQKEKEKEKEKNSSPPSRKRRNTSLESPETDQTTLL